MFPIIQNSILPSTSLSQVIHHYEWFEFENNISESGHIIYPNFATGILFVFCHDQPISVRSDNIGEVELTKVGFLPPTTMLVHKSRLLKLKALRVIFQPGGLASVFDLSMEGFRDEFSHLPLSIKQELESLYMRMLKEVKRSYCIQQFEDYLSTKVLGGIEYPLLFRAVKTALNRLGSDTSAQCLSNILGHSKRQLNRKMNKQLGLSVKQFLKINRFCEALEYLHFFPNTSISQTAHSFGYCDQAHFGNDFKRMTGATPKAYLQSLIRKEFYFHEKAHSLSGLILAKKR